MFKANTKQKNLGSESQALRWRFGPAEAVCLSMVMKFEKLLDLRPLIRTDESLFESLVIVVIVLPELVFATWLEESMVV